MLSKSTIHDVAQAGMSSIGVKHSTIPWLRATLALFVSLGFSLSSIGCTAVQTIPDERERAILFLDVEPASTSIYIDAEYRGVVEGWTGNAVPIEPGDHRLELRAHGYITRRFDINARPGDEIDLRVVMEPTLDGDK